ncbi:transcriptional regulator [Stenotrophomonas sp.]|uniref:helix-turn-helix domain-containing protein n=1 Tax=Stenotrophomonas sp. TaxID=69392 RepID=UPI0028A98387|nr:transcriptional regulator [Stenotrophomonas sp.]
MNISPIRNPADYKLALKSISKLVETDPAPDSPEGEFLDVTATLIEAYEVKQFAIEAPDPIQAIQFRMEQAGLEPKDLAASIGKPI